MLTSSEPRRQSLQSVEVVLRRVYIQVQQVCTCSFLFETNSQRCAGRSLCVAVLRSLGLVSLLVRPAARAFPSRSITPLPAGRVNKLRRLTAALMFRSCTVPQLLHCQVGSRLSFAFTFWQFEQVLLDG